MRSARIVYDVELCRVTEVVCIFFLFFVPFFSFFFFSFSLCVCVCVCVCV